MLVDRIRRVYEEITKVERVAAQFPDDIYIQANLNSLRYDAQELEHEWAEETRLAQKEVCRYRMIPSYIGQYSIRAVTQSLLDFQELFSQIYDAIKNGAKKQARLAAEMVEQTKFNLAFTYPGSLGVAMSVDSTPDLFNGPFDEAIDAVMQVVDAQDEHDVRDMAKALGEAVVKRAYDWARINSYANYAVDLDWTTLKGTRKGGMIDVTAFSRLVSVIDHTSDSIIKPIKVRGVLVGLDSRTKRFRFVDPDGDDYAGPLSEIFPAGAVWQVNETYIADIEVEETVEYATDATRHINRLKHLEPAPKS
ncbi:hypothetical protein [Acidisphaera sp. S103]|uniref:hypothetical protein n=1 Tax=Acidisphaera sp. S103 TaxID=1747223 RepID=UPI00131B207C|nr:hypothetical protein [Acidisphaera sp. S103]